MYALPTLDPAAALVAFVRVRPAFAGEGRYFVRVPPGTNSMRYAVSLASITWHACMRCSSKSTPATMLDLCTPSLLDRPECHLLVVHMCTKHMLCQPAV